MIDDSWGTDATFAPLLPLCKDHDPPQPPLSLHPSNSSLSIPRRRLSAIWPLQIAAY